MLLYKVVHDAGGNQGNISELLEALFAEDEGVSVSWMWLDPQSQYIAQHLQSSVISFRFKWGEEALSSLRDRVEESEPNAWIGFELPLANGKVLYGWHIKIKLSESASSGIAVCADEPFKLSERLDSKLSWAMTTLGLTRRNEVLQYQLTDLQKLMLFQVVWAETLEWIKGVENEDDEFFRELLVRLEIVTGASGSALELRGQRGEPPKWLEKGLTLTKLQGIAAALGDESILESEKSLCLGDLSEKCQPPGSCQDIDQLNIFPIQTGDGVCKGTLYLAKSKGKPVFSLADEMYISQMVSQAYSGFEKNALLAELEKSNQQLVLERQQQEKLISQLQDTRAQLLQSEKLASIGQLAAGVAHEINNPIGYVSSNLTTLNEYISTLFELLDEIEERLGGDKAEVKAIFKELEEKYETEYIRGDVTDLMKESNEGIYRVKQIIQSLKDFSRPDTGQFELGDLNQYINKTLNIVHNEIKYKAEVIKDFGELPKIEMVESQIGQVILNLVVNAGHAIEHNGVIRVSTRVVEDGFVCVSVADNGSGIAKENLSKLYDPFFTTKPVGQGTGLGLALSYGIVNKHHGRLEVESELGKGTTFYVYLPVKQPKQGEEQ
ncbi:ATP-binding protein [Hahella aquimaris]|uniref:sensor histidine kinase n=1 Tax=Hahella sp. HNIBRBA332 TaxID=3015983 RepID=UPI00273C3967|nr:ATP-binding protein [Hahella sp. HNIBRBA332]WLQ15751.1 ATP-binding protein [Hahella sp. HNIBRBA332]